MNGVIYARYSSENQREESIEGQLRECTAFAEKNEIHIIETYIDRAFSAKTDRRPDFQRMIKESGKKAFEIVLVWKLDRFARNRYDSATYKAKLKKNGVRVVSATEAISAGSEGILLESVLEGMAEYYSADLSEKVLRGHTENALHCKCNGGTLPIGFVIDRDKHYQLDPLTAPLVRRAFESYAEGRMMQEIAEELNRQGVVPYHGKRNSVDTVSGMLKNRKYIGEYRYREIIVPDGIPRIVSDDLFERVQEKIAKNKKAPARHKAEDDYLLTTKLFCGECGSMMFGECGTNHQGNVYRYYKCSSAKRHTGCHKKAVQKMWIENLVVESIHQKLNDADLISKWIDEILRILAKENEVLPLLRKELAETNRGIENILNAIQHGIYTESTKDRLTTLEQRRKDLDDQIQVESFRHPKLTHEQLEYWFEHMAQMDIRKREQRQRLVDTFINAIFLYDDKLVITFNYQNGTKTISKEDWLRSDLSGHLRPFWL
ncbi:MAG: recombinase family protein [Clostridia bacterium]|nr:recombinase family protein [Clostridia bacterium]